MKGKCLVAFLGFLLLGAAWPAPPRNFVVSVRIDSDTRENGQGAGIVIGTGQAFAGAYATEHGGNQNSIQQVSVLEGGTASMSIGQTLMPPLHQVFVGNNGIASGVGYSETVVMRDVGSGFTVTPRSHGQQMIQVEIALQQELPNVDSLNTSSTRLVTTVSGPLGQWILIGGARRQEDRHQADLVRNGTRTGAIERSMWVRVDPGQ